MWIVNTENFQQEYALISDICNDYHLLIYICNRRSLEENADGFQNVPVGNLMSLQEFEGILDMIW